jgi:hypothetical protein
MLVMSLSVSVQALDVTDAQVKAEQPGSTLTTSAPTHHKVLRLDLRFLTSRGNGCPSGRAIRSPVGV